MIGQLFLRFALLLCPLLSFGFSETEIDSLESGGTKNFSSSPWRTEISLSLQRNLELNSHLGVTDLFNPGKDVSLLDLSNLYYTLGFKINYSFNKANGAQNWLKDGDFFVSSRFNSPIKGHHSNLKNYSGKDYIQYGLGDLVAGLSFPIIKKEKWLNYLSFSSTIWPLSRFSKEAGLSTTANIGLNSLFFLKKKSLWNLAFSFSQTLSYNHYTKDSADKKGIRYNIPWDSLGVLNLIYRQNHSRLFPSNTQISTSHYFGINTYSSRLHDLLISASSSWKIKERLYFNFSIGWKDRVLAYNSKNKKVRANPHFNLSRIFASIGLNYSF